MYSMSKSLSDSMKFRHNLRIISKYHTICSNGQSIANKVNKLNPNKIQTNRKIFGFPFKPPSKTSKLKKYSERRLLGYSKDQLFEVVSRVEDYHQFVPACVKSKVMERHETYLRAELEIGIPPLIWEKYTSRVTLKRPDLVTAKCIDGKLFKHLDTYWKFGDGVPNNSQTCTLDFSVEFEFRSLVHSQLVHVFFDEMARQTVNAFLRRAQQLYGKQCLVYSNGSNSPLTHKS